MSSTVAGKRLFAAFAAASFFLLSSLVDVVSPFTPPQHYSSRRGTAEMIPRRPSRCGSGIEFAIVGMVPKYDPSSKRWSPESAEDEPSAGYGPFGSLLRHGPKPFLQRLVGNDDYEQGVLKFMANEGCSRDEAQGNFDAYVRNPNDWAYQRNQEKRGKYKVDYAKIDAKQLVLTGTWASMVLAIVGRLAYCFDSGVNFWEI